MSVAKTLEKEINYYLLRLNSRQKETVLNVVKTFAEDSEEDIWNDKNFNAELDKRTAEYESGKIKSLTLDELENNARKSYKAKSGRKK